MISVLLCISQVLYVTCYEHSQAVTLVEWQEPCTTGSLALNDCNWCRCSKEKRYTCSARTCNEVDVFGHFNDAIANINVGMEGHGVWRSTKTACEPGVQYRRSDLICICNEDGNWPNPICRDVFRVLHLVKPTDEKDPNQQKCSPTNLYLIGCNVCFCPSSGKIEAELCTKKTCTGEDDILEIKEDHNETDNHSDELAIYATCTSEKKYKLGCKTCTCLKNNRLLCENCTESEAQSMSKNVSSYCENVKPGDLFDVECNQCICDEYGKSYCTVKKCLPTRRMFSRDPYLEKPTLEVVLEENTIDNIKCEPLHTAIENCRFCTCFLVNNGQKIYTCNFVLPEHCNPRWKPEFYKEVPLRRSFEQNLKRLGSDFDCVVNTMYEVNCLICNCSLNKKGEKYEVCQTNPKCETTALQDLNDLHGYCEPLHVYKKDCNTCKCLVDGKTVQCTSNVCDDVKPGLEPITIDIVPVIQSGDPCPNGSSYKIDCNVCFCLSNGNAICTTIDCKKQH